MAQKFLMLFLTSEVKYSFYKKKIFWFFYLKNGIVSINFAARVLLGDTKNDISELGRFKSKS